jgi:hypothetical protein
VLNRLFCCCWGEKGRAPYVHLNAFLIIQKESRVLDEKVGG